VASVNGVGGVSFCDDARGDLDVSHVSVDLDGDDVVAGRSDLTTDGDTPDLGTGLDAQRDRLERDLDALDKALALTGRVGLLVDESLAFYVTNGQRTLMPGVAALMCASAQTPERAGRAEAR